MPPRYTSFILPASSQEIKGSKPIPWWLQLSNGYPNARSRLNSPHSWYGISARRVPDAGWAFQDGGGTITSRTDHPSIVVGLRLGNCRRSISARSVERLTLDALNRMLRFWRSDRVSDRCFPCVSKRGNAFGMGPNWLRRSNWIVRPNFFRVRFGNRIGDWADRRDLCVRGLT